MMNILAIGLVLTSLVTGAVWSPPPPSNRHDDNREEVIVKGGHCVVVVEFDKEGGDGNTKVLISPHDPSNENNSPVGDDAESSKLSGPRELVCDAFGKCKHKIASALGRTKEKVSETAHGISDKAHDVEEHAKEAASGAAEKAKNAFNEAVGQGKHAAETINEAKSKLSEKVSFSEKKVDEKSDGGTVGKAKEKMAQGIGKAKEVVVDVMETVRDGKSKAKNFDILDSPKRMGEDIQRNVTGKVEEGAEHVMEQTKEAVQKVGQKSFGEIVRKLQEVAYDVFWYIVSPEKVDAVVGLIHILGFSTAYGMCVWVTFVSSYILGRYLPRQQFGMVQSRIYPVYFRAMAYCVGAALIGHLVSRRMKSLSSMVEIFQCLSLLSALLMVLTNMIWLEPKSTKVMFERMKIEKEEGRGIAGAAREGIADHGGDTVVRPPSNVVATERQDVLRMNDKLKRLNSYSSALNVSTLVVLTWHMAYMGQRLQATR
ncbi:hypothetical protein OSB04_003992 [Centaurea solstitialis]|uniref:TMEM205-like domain-containing protein n=1 Tax=Centaurea solstitialis TaxID=347529 RepID=A0AA38WVU8_9ASTR|nr:hypothetical protein OSB04_003992 [Centaurea solstitialis]